MLDFTFVTSKKTEDALLRIADALERAYPPPAKASDRKPRPVSDLGITDDDTLAAIEDDEERRRMVMEEEG
jgi:hypothetical protein